MWYMMYTEDRHLYAKSSTASPQDDLSIPQHPWYHHYINV